MNKFSYFILVKFVVIAIYALLVREIILLSREVTFEDVDTSELKSVDIQFDFCYPLDLENEKNCSILDDKDSEEGKKVENKKEWSQCDLQKKPISCCTKNLKKPKEIIEKFEESKLKNTIRVQKVLDKTESNEVTYQLNFGQLCESHKFKDLEPENVNFEMNSNNSQSFDIYLSLVRKFENDSNYLSIRKHLLRRNCWSTKKDQIRCLETDKVFDFEIIHYSVKYLKKPFVTNCVHHRNSTDQNDDCYNRCVREYRKNYYLLTYTKDDDVDLDFSEYQEMSVIIKKCSKQCNQPNCNTAQFYSNAINELTYIRNDDDLSNINGSIRIKAKNKDVEIETIPLINSSKFIWMILISVASFFGIDVYGIFFRSMKMYNQLEVLKIRNKKKNNKKIIFAIIISTISFGFAILCEMVLFDFGRDEGPYNRTYYSEVESIKERSVSVSVCFDPCDIFSIKGKPSTCNNENIFKNNLTYLETHTEKDIRMRVSLKNNIKYVPIRQSEKKIPVFWRGLKKCFLIVYETDNVTPHLPIQRKSMIHLTIEGNVAHFYIEDGNGFKFPTIDSSFTNKSVLHSVDIELHKNLYNCKNYSKIEINETYLTTRDDYIQKCIIEKSIDQNFLPVSVNIKIDRNFTSQFGSYQFKNESELEKRFKIECEKQYPLKDCLPTKTSLTDYELLEEQLGDDENDKDKKYIVVNLTPFLFEKKYFIREDAFIVFHRLLTFFTLFTCFSVNEILKNFIASYLYGFAAIFDFHFVKKLTALIIFFIFLSHYFLLFYWLASTITKTFVMEVVNEIEFPEFRLCYEHEHLKKFIDEEEPDEHSITYLNENTFKLTDLLEKIVLYNEDKSKQIIESKDLNFKYNDLNIFFIDNLKCFNFNINKTYDATNPMVPKLEKLIELHINLTLLGDSKRFKKRIFLFLNHLRFLNFDSNEPFDKADATIYYLQREFAYEDLYWEVKNPGYVLNELFGKNEKKFYYNYYMSELTKSFAIEQSSTTTSVPMDASQPKNDLRFELPIKNRKFNSYVWFRSLSSNKNYFELKNNNLNLKTYYGEFFKEDRSKNENLLKLSLRPNLIKIKTLYKNTYTLMEVFIYTIALAKIYFKFNFIELPEIAERTWPLIKFSVFLFLYCIVVGSLYLFDSWYRLIKFLELKNQ